MWNRLLFLLLAMLACSLLPGCAADAALLNAGATPAPAISPTKALPSVAAVPHSASSTPQGTRRAVLEKQPRANGTQTQGVPLAQPAVTVIPRDTPTWVPNGGGAAHVPILAYHHISDAQPENRYYTGIKLFRSQMETLREAGYTAIPISLLENVLRGGGTLPGKAVVISFDDGNLDVYQNAFPIMKSLGFAGVFYIIPGALGADGYVNAGQLQEMITAGWEIGSHSMTHADLTQDGVDLEMEMNRSWMVLESQLGVPVLSFAYPYALTSPKVLARAGEYGYSNGVCAGWTNTQRLDNIFCLSRRFILTPLSIDEFYRMVEDP